MNGCRETMLQTISLIRIQFNFKHMKSLTQFIKESQEINEGLLGDIVRKLLDTSLSWIEGSAKWVADHVVKTTAELWDTTKGLTKHISDHGWDMMRQESGVGGKGAPKSQEEFISILNGVAKDKPLNECVQTINDLYKEMEDEVEDKELLKTYLFTAPMNRAQGILTNKKSSKKERDEAIKVLEDIKKECPKLARSINAFVKKYKEEQKNNKKK